MVDDKAADGRAGHTSIKGAVALGLKRAYVATAHGLGRGLTAVGLLPTAAPPRRRRLKHWLVSLTKVHDSLAIAQLGVPWWTYAAIDQVDDWLRERTRPIRVFEYGSGASTLWLAERADEVVSVEHHHEFAKLLRPALAERPNVTFLEVAAEPCRRPRIGSAKAGSERLDFYGYVHAIDRVDGLFDLVVIDGRAREACLQAAIGRLHADGLIVFDNTHRARYQRAIAQSGFTEDVYRGLTPTLPYPDRTSLLTRPGGTGSDALADRAQQTRTDRIG